MKYFNTEGICNPDKHYMVDITDRLRAIRQLVDAGKYFTINRARQYGKTTTINALCKYLKDDYYILSLDFQTIGSEGFQTEGSFARALAEDILDKKEFGGADIPDEVIQQLTDMCNRGMDTVRLADIIRIFLRWCKETDRPFLLIIDEVDSAANYQVFLDFLAQLRYQYLEHEKNAEYVTFHSVILAGVTDIKHLKRKVRDDEKSKVNSPWNVAVDFKIDMSLPESGIKGMLDDYCLEQDVKMNTGEIAGLIYDYTSGYPFLVSKICKLLAESEELREHISISGQNDVWTEYGVSEAVRLLLREDGVTLLESLSGKLTNYPDIKIILRDILMEGRQYTYNSHQDSLVQMKSFGFIRDNNGKVAISNRIFETFLYDIFISDEEFKCNSFSDEGALNKNIFVKNGRLDMELILEHFRETYVQIFGPLEERFKEKDGREQFLLYLKPIINGTGNYYIEAQTRTQTRTDVIVDYLGTQYVIELKIWRGERYNAAGEEQIRGYLDYFGLDTGYMLSFNFNKNKTPGMKRVEIDGKVLYEETV